MTTMFVVGRVHVASPGVWDFQGVFSTEEAAAQACRDYTYFVGPAQVDTPLPHTTMPEWPGAFFPVPVPTEKESP